MKLRMNVRLFSMLIAFAGGLWSLPSSANAQTSYFSAFSNGLEGWTIGPGTEWRSSGGNSGGYLSGNTVPDPQNIGPTANAPSNWLGDWRQRNECGRIVFDYKVFTPGCGLNGAGCDPTYIARYRVSLSGPGGSAYWLGPIVSTALQGTQWLTFEVPLAASNWTLTTGTWNGLLTNVTQFQIPLELLCNNCNPDDIMGLDNVGLFGVAYIESQPRSGSRCSGSDAAFSVTVRAVGNPTFQWRKDGNPISFASNPSATSATLNIQSVQFADAGSYDCIITNFCGSVTSEPALLTVCRCLACPADFNEDGGVDGSDVSVFFEAWEAGHCDADANADGGVDGADVGVFFAAWEAGGC